MFKLLQARGAPMGLRTLHWAAARASIETVTYLLDEMGISVNALDTPVDQPLPEYYGTPLNYAVRTMATLEDGTAMVEFLLQRGADPTTRNRWDDRDAFDYAKMDGRHDLVQLMTAWQRERKGED
ncbi:hypothetical protein BDZ85DRAFT_264910 [Elsinoe ampelina]|uniref:Uncharacterized protein n=1 Tax=Elsinoe ampelina TaxID=302913 RepID=A0A6A6G8V4_9PEZI|nr:hypothetical protein BDZ85DRAFT_264910 [Elsinoe ampelina]